MSKNLNKLKQNLKQMQRAAGLPKQTVGTVLKRLGRFQALADSTIGGDPQNISKLQSQLTALKLDDRAVAEVVSGIRQMRKTLGSSSVTLKEKEVTGLMTKLQRVQSQMAALKSGAAASSSTMADLQKIMKKADSMIYKQIKSLNLSDKKVTGLMKKLKG